MAKLKTGEAMQAILKVQKEIKEEDTGKILKHYHVQNSVHAEHIELCLRQVFENNCEAYIPNIVIDPIGYN